MNSNEKYKPNNQNRHRRHHHSLGHWNRFCIPLFLRPNLVADIQGIPYRSFPCHYHHWLSYFHRALANYLPWVLWYHFLHLANRVNPFLFNEKENERWKMFRAVFCCSMLLLLVSMLTWTMTYESTVCRTHTSQWSLQSWVPNDAKEPVKLADIIGETVQMFYCTQMFLNSRFQMIFAVFFLLQPHFKRIFYSTLRNLTAWYLNISDQRQYFESTLCRKFSGKSCGYSILHNWITHMSLYF